MEAQKKRSRQDAKVDAGDWIILSERTREEFVGYDLLEAEVEITRYRKISPKRKGTCITWFSTEPLFMQKAADR
jgi:alanyl-tRNA synthetase